MSKHSDELVLIVGLIVSFGLLSNATYLGLYGLWGSLAVLVLVAAYYSVTFFKSNNLLEKLFYYLLTLPLIIGYFAMVYKAFGIIDTSTNEIVKPDWLNSFYFSVVTWTTLGYGDYKPIEDLKIWVIIEALMGYIFMGLLVGKVLFISARAGKQGT